MNALGGRPVSLSSLLLLLSIIFLLSRQPESALDSIIYTGCSQMRYAAGSPYQYNLNSILTSLINSAAAAGFNSFNISSTRDAVYGLYQCRGDLAGPDCSRCVSDAVSRLGVACPGAAGAALQLDGCFVRYDNASFMGEEDLTVASDRCGPAISGGGDLLARKDDMLSYLAAGVQYYRVAGSGGLQGVAQCTGDLSVGECQDCVAEAIRRLRNECGSSLWGDMFLAKCYARYSERGYTSSTSREDDDDMERTLAIIIGLIAAVAVLLVFLSFLSRFFDRKRW